MHKRGQADVRKGTIATCLLFGLAQANGQIAIKIEAVRSWKQVSLSQSQRQKLLVLNKLRGGEGGTLPCKLRAFFGFPGSPTILKVNEKPCIDFCRAYCMSLLQYFLLCCNYF